MDNLKQLKQPIIKQFKFDYSDNPISEEHVLTLLGYDLETVPEPIIESIHLILEVYPTKLNIRSGYKIFNPRKVKFHNDCFIVDNRNFNCGKIIYNNLKDSETLAFIVLTIGEEISIWSQSLMNSGEMLKGYLVDKIASELAESIADKTELLIADEIKDFELNLTSRYSPGYCGWNVSDQQNIFSLLPDKFCEISLNEHSMMFPIKSISAVVGIGKNIERKDYQCNICEEEFCYKRERNEQNK